MRSETQKLFDELERTRRAVNKYVARFERDSTYYDVNHAAAVRASLDLSRQLSVWRQARRVHDRVK